MTVPFAQDHATVAAATYQNTPLAYRQLSVTGAATLPALLAAASPAYTLTGFERWALVSVEGNAIRWTDDGQAPTASYGQPIAAGTAADLATLFASVQMVSQTGTATVDISFYK
jgi:hypothetical protein